MTPEELVNLCGDGIFNLALRLCGNTSDAQDIAQEALLKAIKGLPDFRGDSSIHTWVYRITVNTWKNWLRANSRHGGAAVPLDPVADASGLPPDTGCDVGKELEAGETKAAVDAALSEMSPEDRAILTLRELDECSYAEIAHILGLAEGTVKSRLFRAREVLRGKLSGLSKGGTYDA